MMRLLALLLWLLAVPAWAVDPSEVLDDPVLEERARALSSQLRCPVCQNESIDESNAAVARELRVVLRERLLAGDSDAEVLDYMVIRFGEFVLMKPQATGANLVLWLTAPVLFLLALVVGWYTIRRRPVPTDQPLTQAEQDEINKIIER